MTPGVASTSRSPVRSRLTLPPPDELNVRAAMPAPSRMWTEPPVTLTEPPAPPGEPRPAWVLAPMPVNSVAPAPSSTTRPAMTSTFPASPAPLVDEETNARSVISSSPASSVMSPPLPLDGTPDALGPAVEARMAEPGPASVEAPGRADGDVDVAAVAGGAGLGEDLAAAG